MKTSEAGIKFIEKNEGLCLSVYIDAGKPCIGYGHDILPEESIPNSIDALTAQLLLEHDVKKWEDALNSYHLNLTQNQFDALIDFTHNLGIGHLSQLLSHGLKNAPEQLLRWDHEGASENAGLLSRRKQEVALFTKVA